MARNLVIAPPTDLEYQQAETQNILNALGADVLIDDVDLRSVMAALGRGYRYIFIVAHGTPEGIQLEDGLLTTSLLIQLLRSNPPELLAINTCSSVSIAVAVHEDAGVPTIGTMVDVPDRQAYVTMSKLAQALGEGKDIQAAYKVSKPHPNRTYVLMNGSPRMGGANQSEDNARLLVQLYTKLERIEAKVGELESAKRRQYTFRRDQIAAFVLFWVFLFAPPILLTDNWESAASVWAVLSRLAAALLFSYTFGFINPGRNDDRVD
jgi:hypothetical protein